MSSVQDPGHQTVDAGAIPPGNAPTTARSRVLVAAALVLAAVPFLAEAWFLLSAPRSVLVGTMPDDGFYYLEIGQRAAAGQGFTFDGIHSTSGYHPLWQWVVTVVEWIVPGETAQIRAVRLLGLVIVALSFALVTRVLWRAYGPMVALGGLLLASHSVVSLRFIAGGMETPLALLGLAVCLTALDSFHRGPDRRRALVVGLCSAVLVLARLDMAAVVPIAALSVGLRSPRRRNLSGWAIGCAAVGVPYVSYHLLAHHSMLTTSATVKQYWVSDHVDALGGMFGGAHLRELARLLRDDARSILGGLHDGPMPVVALVGFVALTTLAVMGGAKGIRGLVRRGGHLRPTGMATATVAAMVSTKVAFDLVLVPLWFLTWYAAAGQVTATWAIGAAAGAGVAAVARQTSRQVAVGVAVVACLAAFPGHLDWVTDPAPPQSAWQLEIDRAADWLLDNRPPGSYGAFDAGLVGYRLDGVVPVVNLDGLVNDRGYATYLSSRPDRLQMALHEGVDIVVNGFDRDSRDGLWACATTLYEGSRNVDPADPSEDTRVYVLDLQGCR